MNLGQEIEPREVLPFTDEEIRDLYRRACAEPFLASPKWAADQKPAEVEYEVQTDPTNDDIRFMNRIIGSFLVGPLLLVGFFTGLVSYGVPSGLALFIVLATAIVIYSLLNMAPKKLDTPIEPKPKQDMIDPLDDHVLNTVVDFVAREPLRQEHKLQTSIRQSLESLEASILELPTLADRLAREAETAGDESFRLLIVARRDAAQNALQKLKELRDEFKLQSEEARSAVQPLREMLQKFEKVRALNDSLARIQAAHGLIEEAEESLVDNRVQLKLIRSISITATARLREIETIISSHEKAKLEIANL